jgi:hypothetical protein
VEDFAQAGVAGGARASVRASASGLSLYRTRFAAARVELASVVWEAVPAGGAVVLAEIERRAGQAPVREVFGSALLASARFEEEGAAGARHYAVTLVTGGTGAAITRRLRLVLPSRGRVGDAEFVPALGARQVPPLPEPGVRDGGAS